MLLAQDLNRDNFPKCLLDRAVPLPLLNPMAKRIGGVGMKLLNDI